MRHADHPDNSPGNLDYRRGVTKKKLSRRNKRRRAYRRLACVSVLTMIMLLMMGYTATNRHVIKSWADDSLAMFIARSPGERGYAKSVKPPIIREKAPPHFSRPERPSIFDETDWTDLNQPIAPPAAELDLGRQDFQPLFPDFPVVPRLRDPVVRGEDPDVVVGAVPEPDTWALLIVGFALCGAAMRMRRRPAVQTQPEIECR